MGVSLLLGRIRDAGGVEVKPQRLGVVVIFGSDSRV